MGLLNTRQRVLCLNMGVPKKLQTTERGAQTYVGLQPDGTSSVYGISISASIAYEIYSNSYRFEHLYPFQKHTLIWLIMTSPYNRGGGSGWGSMRANMRHILNLYGNKSQS